MLWWAVEIKKTNGFSDEKLTQNLNAAKSLFLVCVFMVTRNKKLAQNNSIFSAEINVDNWMISTVKVIFWIIGYQFGLSSFFRKTSEISYSYFWKNALIYVKV